MMPFIKQITIILLILIPFLGSTQNRYAVKSHEIAIDGTSNVMSWSAEVEQVSGHFDIAIEDGKITSIENVRIRVDTRSIEGSEGRRMNDKIYESLETGDHPFINYELRDILSLYENPGTARITSRGVLTVAGVSRVIELEPVGRVLRNGDIEFTGTQTIDMTDYNIDPPTAMFGVLRTGKEVELSYRVVVSPE